MSKLIAAAAAVLAASALILPTAGEAQEVNSVRVSYADLNLAYSPAQLTLQRRMHDAARTVCVIEDSRELALESATRICRNDAMVRAWPAYQAAVASARHGSVTVIGAAALVISAH
ncbi:MAG TPA: UrcA family protein [Sphingomicrobium sp.]|nr:UrcA family protein [Sphingomicrobium sp.]